MSEWQNKSDSDINKAVVELINKINDDGSDFEEFFAFAINCGLENGTFDPCNNWSDGGPIISDNKISLVYMCDEWEAHALENNDEAFNTQDKNPLRAAMIVYLEMKGVKP